MFYFLRNIIVLSTIISIFILADNYNDIIYYYNTKKKYLPAKKVTNSYFLNEKIRFLSPQDSIDILAIGSSITVNNLSSNKITSLLDTKNYINVGSYGFSIFHCAEAIKAMIEIYDPNTVIICTNLEDFKLNYIKFNIENIKDEIIDESNVSLLDIIFDRYYKKHLYDIKFDKLNNSHYNSNKFDSYGGIPLNSNNFEIDSSLWNKRVDYNSVVDFSYLKFSEMSKYLSEMSIKLIVIQSPTRTTLQNEEYEKEVLKHLNKIESIIKPNNHTLLDLSRVQYPDTFFTDFQHLNSQGSDSLTAQALYLLKNFN